MAKRLGLFAAGVMRALLASDRAHARKLDEANQAAERPKHKCLHPDCAEQTHAVFCSAGCASHFKQNFRAVRGRNVRVNPHSGLPIS